MNGLEVVNRPTPAVMPEHPPETPKTMLRGSNITRAELCGASILDEGLIIDGPSDPASLGTAVHYWMTSRISGHHAEAADLAGERKLDVIELSRLCHFTWKVWTRYAHFFESPEVEKAVAIQDTILGRITGHVDVLGLVPSMEAIGVVDFKTGYLDADCSGQVKFYALAALRATPFVKKAYTLVLRPREDTADGMEYSRDYLEEWWADVSRRIGQFRYNPGPHCGYCPRGATCEAKTALITQGLRSFAGDDKVAEFFKDLPTDPAKRGAMLSAGLRESRFIEKTIERFQEMVKADVKAHGGKLPDGDGGEIRINVQEQELIVFSRAWESAVAAVGLDDFAECASISKTKLLEKISAKAPRGLKTANGKAFMDDLRGKDAVTTRVIEKLETKIKKEAIK